MMVVAVLLLLLCYLPLLVLTFAAMVGLIYLRLRRILHAVLFALFLSPLAVLAIGFAWVKITGQMLEFGCVRGGLCCGGRPLNALNAPALHLGLTCATPPSAPSS